MQSRSVIFQAQARLSAVRMSALSRRSEGVSAGKTAKAMRFADAVKKAAVSPPLCQANWVTNKCKG